MIECLSLPVVSKVDPIVEHILAHSLLFFGSMSKEVKDVE